jgi:hypothetical protein
VHSQQTAAASNGKPSIIPASTQSPLSPLSPTLAITSTPVRDEPNAEPSCDSYGVCYEVSLKCTDTRIVVNVRTSRPFHGRIYALGRSETCNAHIRNSQQFQLDMSLGGQDCNTQSLVILHCTPSILPNSSYKLLYSSFTLFIAYDITLITVLNIQIMIILFQILLRNTCFQ